MGPPVKEGREEKFLNFVNFSERRRRMDKTAESPDELGGEELARLWKLGTTPDFSPAASPLFIRRG